MQGLGATFSATLLDHVLQDDVSLKIGIALSGGPDSMVLAHLLKQWADQNGRECIAFHVDHRLRPESASEAELVAAWCASQDMTAHILVWTHEDIATGIQAQARQARYDLLVEACKKSGISTLFLGHHRDDQVETFLARLDMASGLKGLTAMSETRIEQGIRLVRPLLSSDKKELRAYAEQWDLPYLTDRSNSDPKYKRSYIRDVIRTVAKGDPQFSHKICRTIERLKGANQALEHYEHQALLQYAALYTEGFGSLELSLFSAHPHDICRRVLEHMIGAISGGDYPPRFEGLSHLLQKITTEKRVRGCTLGGCFFITRRHRLYIYREPAGIAKAHKIQTTGSFYWDKRFFVDNIQEDAIHSGVTVDMLGRHCVDSRVLPDRVKALPHKVRQGLPALFKKGQLLSVLMCPVEGQYPCARICFQPQKRTILKPMEYKK